MKNIYSTIGLVQIFIAGTNWALGYASEKKKFCIGSLSETFHDVYETKDIAYIKFYLDKPPVEFWPDEKDKYDIKELECKVFFGSYFVLSPELDKLATTVHHKKVFHEYAVEMHDEDAAMTRLASVFIIEDPKEKETDGGLFSDTLAEDAAKRINGYLFGSNHVEYASEGRTGISKVINYNCFNHRLNECVNGVSKYKESDFYQMNE